MDKAEFLRQEYVSLRGEMGAIKARIHRLVLVAIVLVPAALFTAFLYDSLLLKLLAPIMAISASLLYLTENMSLMRCGRYVKVYIEHGVEGVVGWEHWLETRDLTEPRNVDRFVVYCFQFLLVFQFLSSAALAVHALRLRFGPLETGAGAAFYAVAGGGYLYFLARNLRLSTSTGSEDVCLKALLTRPHCIYGPESD